MQLPNIRLSIHYIVVLIAIIGFESVYRDALFNYSITFQENLESFKTPYLTYIFVTFSTIGQGAPYVILGVLIYNWQGHIKGVYYMLFLTGQLLIQNIGKIYYAEPRPFMVSDKINPINCSYEWGQPSGHSMLSAGYALFVFLDYYHENPRQWAGRKILDLILAISYFLMVGFARIYQGVHSIDQVVYGWQLGIWIALFFHYCLRDRLFNHLETVLYEREVPISFTRYCVVSSTLALVGFALQTAAYYYTESNFTMPALWQTRMDSKCSVIQPLYRTLHYKSFLQAGMYLVGYGCYIGTLMFRKMHGQAWEGMLKTSLTKYFQRIFALVIMCLPFMLMQLLIPYDIQSIWVLMVLKEIVPTLGATLLMMNFSFYFFFKYDLIRGEEIKVVDNQEYKPLLGDEHQ